MNKHLSVIHLEDDPLILEETQMIISSFPDIDYLGGFPSLTQAIEVIHYQKPDVIIVDIQLRDGVVFEQLGQLALKSQLVILSGFQNYATEAFKLGAIEYLTKPVNVNELREVFEKARRNIMLEKFSDVYAVLQSIENLKASTSENKKISIVTAGKTYLEYIDRIEFIEADGSYSKFHIADGRTITSGKLFKYYKLQISDFDSFDSFIDISRSAIININYVKVIIREKNKLSVRMQNGTTLTVSNTQRAELLKMLENIHIL